MNDSRGNGFLLCTVLGLAYAVLISVAVSRAEEHGLLWFVATVPAVLGVIPFGFPDDAQVSWYQRALLVPWVGGAGVVFALMPTEPYAPLYAALIYVLVVPVSFVVWLVGAITLWRRAWLRAMSGK